jgi:hypothetical protein
MPQERQFSELINVGFEEDDSKLARLRLRAILALKSLFEAVSWLFINA